MAKKQITKSYAIKIWQQLDREAERKGEKPVGAKPLSKKLGIKPYNLTEQVFAGQSLTEIKLKNNIRISSPEKPFTKDQLLEKYHATVSKYKEIPSWRTIRHESGTADNIYRKYFLKTDSLKLDIIKAYRQWLEKHHPKSKNLKIVDKYLEKRDKPKTSSDAVSTKNKSKQGVWKKGKGKLYGQTLGFRNLINEPTNEQGVVFLFGMVSEELGFTSIDDIQAGFPDCEAKRLIEGTNQQQSVRIEFEFKSREFLPHVHDEKKCDLVVCWKDNWKDCPIEVLELSKAIKNLPS